MADPSRYMAPPEKIETDQQLQTHPKVITLNPSQSTRFDLVNATPNTYLHTDYLQIAVLDSPIQPFSTAVATMIVPIHQESDWIFTTKRCYRQLNYDNPQLSRLILIGNTPITENPCTYFLNPSSISDSDQRKSLENYWTLFVRNHLCLVSDFEYEVAFLTYNKDDDVICRLVHLCDYGKMVGPMLIEIVGLKVNDNVTEFRRRLRFKRTPNVIQTQLLVDPNPRIETILGLETSIDQLKPKFVPYTGILVQPNLNAMLTGPCLIATSNVDEKIRRKKHYKPRVLCVGVGGGALLSFLRAKLDFEVVGVEVSWDVLWAARQFFGLVIGKCVRLILGDGIHLIHTVAQIWSETLNNHVELPYYFHELHEDGQNLVPVEEIDAKFDVIMVDLVASSLPAIAPPSSFMEGSVLKSARRILDRKHGIHVINVVRRIDDQSSYYKLVERLKKYFHHNVYVIEVGDDNFVLTASRSKNHVIDEGTNSFSTRVRAVISKEYLRNKKKARVFFDISKIWLESTSIYTRMLHNLVGYFCILRYFGESQGQ